MKSRREMLKLALAAPMLFGRCAPMPAEVSDGLLHARPDLFEGTASNAATPEPQPLGLSSARDGNFYVPRNAAGSLLVYLHGAGGAGQRAISRLIEDADRLGVILVAPDSRRATWGFEASDAAPDLAFIDDALEKLFTTYRVDRRRVAIGGFSDGASMALSWGLTNGTLFSTIVAFSPGFVAMNAPPSGKPRVFLSHGTSDQILPVDRCGRRIARELRGAGYGVQYREFDGDHTIPAEIRRAAFDWAFA